MIKQNRILWVDDEIELLRSHVIFLSEKGFIVDTVTNGEDAVSSVKEKYYYLIFLDEMMAGMGGLETLAQIKDYNANIPVVMVTKNEEESLMNEAIGFKISDYLTKPVNPSQVLLVCKKILEGKKITGEFAAKDYLQDFNQFRRQCCKIKILMSGLKYILSLSIGISNLMCILKLVYAKHLLTKKEKQTKNFRNLLRTIIVIG